MAFFRTKQVKGRPYQYMVESYREDGKIRQRNLLYIGAPLPELQQRILQLVHDGVDYEDHKERYQNWQEVFNALREDSPGLDIEDFKKAFCSLEAAAYLHKENLPDDQIGYGPALAIGPDPNLYRHPWQVRKARKSGPLS